MEKLTGPVPFVISLILYYLLGRIILLLVFINELARLIVGVYLYQKYQGVVKLVQSGGEAVWAAALPGKCRICIAGHSFKGKVDLDTVANLYHDRIKTQRHPNGQRMYEKLEWIFTEKCGYACWQRDEHFDPANHFRTLDPNTLHSEGKLKELFREWGENMSETRPQWEFVLVPRYKDKTEVETSILFLRMHHAYGDGVSMSLMCKNTLLSSPNAQCYFDPLEFKIPLWKRLLYYGSALIYFPSTLLFLAKARHYAAPWPSNLTLPEGEKGSRNYTWSSLINLDSIKRIQRACKVTIPSIMENAFIASAKAVLPANRTPRIWCVGDVVALVPYPHAGLQNRFACLVYEVDSTIQDDFERLRRISDAAKEAVRSPMIPVIYYFGTQIMGRFPVPMCRDMLFKRNMFSFVTSNLPYFKRQVKMFDSLEVLDVFGFSPVPSDLGITALSIAYDNKMRLCASACSSWLTSDELDAIVEKIPEQIKMWVTMIE